MKYILIQRPGFKERYINEINKLNKSTSEQLIQLYNANVKTGIVGVHAQAIMLVALRHVIKSRFGVCPIKIEDNIILSLTGSVIISDDKLFYEGTNLPVN